MPEIRRIEVYRWPSDDRVRAAGNPTGCLVTGSGDANSDGMVDSVDYDIWRAQFGTTPGTGSGAAMVGSGSAAALMANPSASAPTASTSTVASPVGDERSSAAYSAAFATLASDHSDQRFARQANIGIRLRNSSTASRENWESLLGALAERKTDRDPVEPSVFSSVAPSERAAAPDVRDDPLGHLFGSLGLKKPAIHSLRR